MQDTRAGLAVGGELDAVFVHQHRSRFVGESGDRIDIIPFARGLLGVQE